MTVGELIRRLQHFPPEFAVFVRLDMDDSRVLAPADVRMDLTDPVALLALEGEPATVPDNYVDSVVIFPGLVDDASWEDEFGPAA